MCRSQDYWPFVKKEKDFLIFGTRSFESKAKVKYENEIYGTYH